MLPELPLPQSLGMLKLGPLGGWLGAGEQLITLLSAELFLRPHLPQGQADLGTTIKSQQGKAKSAEEGEQMCPQPFAAYGGK